MNARTIRFGRRAIGAMALALLAGTAMGQQVQDKDKGSKSEQSCLSQSQNQPGAYIPALRGADLTILQKEIEGGKTCTCIVDHGQIVSCQIDGQDVSLERVQLKGDRITVLDENKSQKLAEIKVPQDTQRFTSGGYRGYNEQRFASNEGRYQTQGQPGYQGQYQQDQNLRNYNTGQDSRYPQDQGYARGSYSQDTTGRSQQPYGQSDWQTRNYNQGNQPTYREDRFYTERQYQPRDQYTSSSGNERYYPSEQRDRYTYGERSYQASQPDRTTYEYRNYNQPSDRTYQDRSYGNQRTYTTPQDRTWGTTEGTYSTTRPMLGVMMSEADRNELRTAGVDTGRYSQGVLVEQVNPGSPAESAGLQTGDIIVLIDGSQPATPELMRDTLARKDFNDTVRLKGIHNGQERNYNVRLFRPQSTGNGRNYYTTGSDTQWNHRMPQQVPPEPNAEFQPGNNNWRPGDQRNSYWHQDENNNYSPTPR